MTDQAVPPETESQPDSKKAAVPAAAAPAANPLAASAHRNPAPSKVPSNVDVSSTAASTATKKSNDTNNNKPAIPAATKAVPATSKSSPSATKYTHPIPTKGAPVLPPVPIHHPYAHHHYYAYHQHMAAAAKANPKDPKAAGKPSTAKPASVPAYNPAQYKKAAGEKGKQGAAASGPPPPPMYPPPPPHLPPHHHAYQAWAAYRYAQQHSQYHGGPPPGPMPPWNPEAYAAAHQAYAAAAKTAAAASKGNNNTSKKGTAGENGAAPTPAAAGAPPHHHYPPHGAPAGPYRYSDPTLRRDALSRISSTSESSKTGTTTTKGSSPSSLPSHSNLSNSPPTPGSQGVAKMVGSNHTPPDPATLHMLELEARAEGATSPSQIEDFHREEVTTMGCTCKKTKCLKLYCQCFAVKIYCGSNCRCLTCNNTPMHEEARQEAIRAILSRNPTAFDTKFQKNNRKIAPPVGIIPHPSNPASIVANGRQLGGMDIPHARTISHKLGCKCRKSACIKKYCECYAGNVKCSANCRCVGCKNMPPGGFGPPPASGNAVAAPVAMKLTPTKNVMTTPVKKEPSWMMSAAQNLTFLKHGSAEKPKRIISRVPSETGSMPSLASSSEDSPNGGSKARSKSLPVNGAKTVAAPSTAERAAVNALQSSEKTAVNALLMAAMAMTEMAGDIGSTNTENRQDTTTASPMTHRESNNGNNNSPEATNRSADEHFETPQRNLLKKFMSPKRKVSDRNAEEEGDIPTNIDESKLPSRNLASAYREQEYDDDDDEEDSPKREHPGNGTPSLLQKVKRSRLGSLKKGARLLERENSNGESLAEEAPTNNGVLPMEMSTPAKATGGVNMADLTPVSARCIDFKKMHVNDSRSDPAVVDSGAL